MLLPIYTVAIRIYGFLIRLAGPFNAKARQFRQGRLKALPSLGDRKSKRIWIHVSSLGEFEQARPVIEQLKAESADLDITLTFFSPSGYEVRKTYQAVDRVLYMPLDTPDAAKHFLTAIQPDLVLFVKYDFWINHLLACFSQEIPVIFFSVILRSDQIYFGVGSALYLPVFRKVTRFFVQNESSQKLLQSSGVKAATVTGDTRLDRVVAIAQQAKKLSILESIKNDLPIVVLGSVWPSDIAFLLPWIERTQNQTRFIIAPHNTAKDDVTAMQEKLPKSTLYSELERVPNQECASILLIDNMGLLASIYAYAKYTYVGGAWRGTLHNTVEPAAHGKPVFFGAHPKNIKFMEAGGLVQAGGAYEISSLDELEQEIDRLEKDPDAYQSVCKNAKEYVSKNSGASKVISEYVLTIIS